MRDPVRVNSARVTHRSVAYPSQYRRVEHTNMFPNSARTSSNYPVVTPSTTFHTPTLAVNHSRPTAGLYQTRLRNPRPLSCMPGIGLDYLPKARLSSPPVAPPMDVRGYVPNIPPPLQARFERDYMSIAEVEQDGVRR